MTSSEAAKGAQLEADGPAYTAREPRSAHGALLPHVAVPTRSGWL